MCIKNEIKNQLYVPYFVLACIGWVGICLAVSCVAKRDVNSKFNGMAVLLVGISPISLAMSLYEAY
jgi:hypothetical protein